MWRAIPWVLLLLVVGALAAGAVYVSQLPVPGAPASVDGAAEAPSDTSDRGISLAEADPSGPDDTPAADTPIADAPAADTPAADTDAPDSGDQAETGHVPDPMMAEADLPWQRVDHPDADSDVPADSANDEHGDETAEPVAALPPAPEPEHGANDQHAPDDHVAPDDHADAVAEAADVADHGDDYAVPAEDTGSDEHDAAPVVDEAPTQTAAVDETEHPSRAPGEPSLHGPMPVQPRESLDLVSMLGLEVLEEDHAGDAPADDAAPASDDAGPALGQTPPAVVVQQPPDDEAEVVVAAADDAAMDHDPATDHDAGQPEMADDVHETDGPEPATDEQLADDDHATAPEQTADVADAAVENHENDETHETDTPRVADAPQVAEAPVVETPPVEAAPPQPAQSNAPSVELALSSEPDPQLVELADVGPLPTVSVSGDQPWQAYARPFDDTGDPPLIAIVVTGLGLNSSATEAAIQQLPGAVTLSFSPYARGLDQWIALARAAGHEVLIDLPMEPSDYPGSDPGPWALMTSLTPEQNMERLEWVLSRATNYVGVGNFMGSRFAADQLAMQPVLEEIRSRGLVYLDNRAAVGDVAERVGAAIGLPVVVSDARIDSMAASPAIDAALNEVESMARRDGTAVAIGSAYPVTIDRLAIWTRDMVRRGYGLAPLSAVVTRQVAVN